MKLIHITAKKFPASTADHLFMKKAVNAFSELLGKDYQFVFLNGHDRSFENINCLNIGLNWKKGITFYLLFWIPYFIFKNKLHRKDVWFYSNDPYILSILIFWRKIFFMKYDIASEWHMLFDNFLDRYISSNSDRLITTTLHIKNIIANRFGIDTNKIKEIYGGVDSDSFKEVKSKDLNSIQADQNLTIGYIGYFKTMGMEKGISVIIDSLQYLSKNVKAVFVGGREDEIVEYEKLATLRNVSERVTFVPVVPQEEIPRYFNNMDIMVIPYPNQKHFRDYGLPMKVYEYMASKKIIVYSRLPVIDEVLSGCGVAFEPDQPKDLAEQIQNIIDKKENYSLLVQNAYDKVLNYSWRERASNIVRFLGEI